VRCECVGAGLVTRLDCRDASKPAADVQTITCMAEHATDCHASITFTAVASVTHTAVDANLLAWPSQEQLATGLVAIHVVHDQACTTSLALSQQAGKMVSSKQIDLKWQYSLWHERVAGERRAGFTCKDLSLRQTSVSLAFFVRVKRPALPSVQQWHPCMYGTRAPAHQRHQVRNAHYQPEHQRCLERRG
jgi:hypothetical protein